MPPKITNIFLPSGTRIPQEIQLTGRVEILEDFLNDQKKHRTVSKDDIEHLQQRLENMRYLNDMQRKNAHIKYIPKPAKKIEGGFQLDSLHQMERQKTYHNCWTMPVIMMLQAHGIYVPQENILASMPEFTKNQSREIVTNDPDMANMLSRDVNGDSANLSQLICKLIPNVKVCMHQYHMDDDNIKDIQPFCEDLKKQVIQSIQKEGSPVALLVGKHFRTIVGIKGDILQLKDSMSYKPDEIKEIPISSLFTKKASISITYLRNLMVLPDQPADRCFVDKPKYLGVDSSGNIFVQQHIMDAEKNCPSFKNIMGVGKLLPSLNTSVSLNNHVHIQETEYYPMKVNQNVVEISLDNKESMTVENIDYSVIYGKETERFDQWNKSTLRKEDFYQNMSQSVYKQVVGFANEARQELMSMVIQQNMDMDKCMQLLKVLAAEQMMRAERIMNDGKPGTFEQASGTPDQFNEHLDLMNPLVNSVFDKLCQSPFGFIAGVEEMLQQDSMQEHVKSYLTDRILDDAKLSADKKNRLVNNLMNKMEHSYESDRLLDLWENQKAADPIYISSSNEFKAVKNKMKQIVELKKQLEGQCH